MFNSSNASSSPHLNRSTREALQNESAFSSKFLHSPKLTSTPLHTPPTLKKGSPLVITRRPLLGPRRYSLSDVTTTPKQNTESKHIQRRPIGPLLASTRYNVNVSTYVDSKSPGLAGRIVQYNEESSKPTHQEKYGSPGLFPIVHLFKKDKPVVVPKAKRVTVRMGSPNYTHYQSPEHSRLLLESMVQKSHNSKDETHDKSPQSVLDALKEISRKRIHVTEEYEVGSDANKRFRKDCMGLEGDTNKRSRVETPTLDNSVSPSKPVTKKFCHVDAVMASHTSSNFSDYPLEKPAKKKVTVGTSPADLPTSPKDKTLINAETQTCASVAKKISQTEEVPPSPTKTDDKISPKEETPVERKPPHKETLKIFDDKPLEIIRKNRLGILLGALTGQEIPLIPMEDRTKNLNGDDEKEVEKVKVVKHVTFSLPETTSSSATPAIVLSPSITQTSASITAPISSTGIGDSSKTSVASSPTSFGLPTAGISFISATKPQETSAAAVASSFAATTTSNFNAITTQNNALSSVETLTSPSKAAAPPSLGGFKFDFGKPANQSASGNVSSEAPKVGGFTFKPLVTTPSSQGNPSAVDTSQTNKIISESGSTTHSATTTVESSKPSIPFGGSSHTNLSGGFKFGENQAVPLPTSSTSGSLSFSPIASPNNKTTEQAKNTISSTTLNFSFGSKGITSTSQVNNNSGTSEVFGGATSGNLFGTPSASGNAKQAFGTTANIPSFGSTTAAATTSAPLFGAATTSATMFGVTTTSTTTFGPATTNAPTFGIAPTTAPSFGAPTTSFGAATTAATFGATTTSAPTFGTSSSAPAFGTTSSAPAFGTTSSVPTFGTTSSVPTFGTTSASPAFGTTSSAFGGTSSSTAPLFGTAATPATIATTSAPFGSAPATTSAPNFGSGSSFGNAQTFAANTSAPTGTFGVPSFGTTATTQSAAFGAPATSAPTFGTSFGSTNFPAPTTTAQQGSLFGNASSASFGTQSPNAFGNSNGSSAFGTPSTTTFGTTSTTATFGAPTTTSAFGAPATTSAFGATTTSAFGAPASTSTFGTATTTSAFGAAANSSIFGGTTGFGTSTSPSFGATTTPSFGATTTPSFGASTTTPSFATTTSNASTFGVNAVGAKTNTFGSSSTTSAFGGSNGGAFGSSTPFGAPAVTTASNTFGSSANTSGFGSSENKPAFNFGGPTTTASTGFGNNSAVPSFGSNSGAFATATGGTFGSTNQSGTFGNSGSGFGGGLSTTPAPFGNNNFNNATPAFGANTTTTAPAFGGNTNTQSFATAAATKPSGIFGTTNSAPAFGGATTFNFGQNNNSGGFGTNNSFGTTSFGNAATTQSFPTGDAQQNGSVFTFGSNTAAPAFGSSAAPSFGSNSGTTATFGSSGSTAPTFGSNTATPAFGSTGAGNAPTFGSSGGTAPAFGSAGGTAPAFGSSGGSAPAFGSSGGSAPAFGSSGGNAAGFGSGGAAAPGIFSFSNNSGAKPVFNFSAGSNAAPGFGGTSAGFNAAGGAFAAPTPGMFSIGTGSTTSGRPRAQVKAKRRT